MAPSWISLSQQEVLDKEIPALVDQQIEQFLVKPREVLNRRAVAEFLAKQGLAVDAKDIADDDHALSPNAGPRHSATSDCPTLI